MLSEETSCGTRTNFYYSAILINTIFFFSWDIYDSHVLFPIYFQFIFSKCHHGHDGRDTENCPNNLRLLEPTDMTIHWKALGKHFLMVPLVFQFN
jgi:hypothetical protein